MPFKDLGRLVAYWRKHPPTHLAVADMERHLLAVQGVDLRCSAPSEPAAGPLNEADVRSFVALANGA